MKNLSKKKLALALFAGLGLGISGTASAGVLATAILEIDNFTLSSGGTPITNISTNNPYIIIEAGNNFGQNTASLASVPGTATNNADPIILGPDGGQFDLASVCQGACPTAIAENDFSTIPFPPSANYARSDNLLQGAIISLDLNSDGTVDVPAGANAGTRSDISLNTLTTSGIANSITGTNTTFNFRVVGGPLDVTFAFDYFVTVFAYVEPGSQAPSTATAGTAWNLDLTNVDTGTRVTRWNPDEINLSASRTDVASGIQATPVADRTGSLSRTVSLSDDVEYQISITHNAQTNARLTAVPEPGSLALLGIGLLGLGGFKLRQRKLSA